MNSKQWRHNYTNKITSIFQITIEYYYLIRFVEKYEKNALIAKTRLYTDMESSGAHNPYQFKSLDLTIILPYNSGCMHVCMHVYHFFFQIHRL